MPEWLRVRDEHGNEFDLPPNHPLIKRKAAEVIEDYPENKGLTAVARPANHRVDKAGNALDLSQQGEGQDGDPDMLSGAEMRAPATRGRRQANQTPPPNEADTNQAGDVGQPEKE